MATYAIGDVQGCHRELVALLEKINFEPARDTLWFAGDLINRGPASLDCLRTIRSLDRSAICVLGNHDLHLIAIAIMGRRDLLKPGDTIEEILDAPDAESLIDWLRSRPLFYQSAQHRTAIVHAGCPPEWTLSMLEAACAEVSEALNSAGVRQFLERMYGNQPSLFSEAESAEERARFTVNAATRMRYVDGDGRLDFRCKGPLGTQQAGLVPWFEHPNFAARALPQGHRLLFGHWASLELDAARAEALSIVPLDTGCVWGRALTAYRLEDGRRFQVAAAQN